MIKSLKKILHILDNNFKKKLFLVQILLLFAAFFEMLGVLSIAPLIHLISDVNVLNDSNQLVTKIFLFLNISNYVSFLKLISVTVLLIFIVNFIVGVYTIYVIEKFAQDAGNFLKLKLFKIFSLQSWIFHSQRETTTYVNKIVTETSRVSQGAILPLLQTNAKLLTGLAIIIFIFIYNPKITIICFLVFFISYFLIFKLIRKKIDKDGIQTSLAGASMYKKIFETFGGIKETILHKKQKKFHDEFYIELRKFSMAAISIAFFKNSPKLFLELIAFSIIILSIIYTLSFTDAVNLKNSMPILAIYTFAGYKLLPIFQNVYYGMLSVRASKSAIDSVYLDLKDKQHINFENKDSSLQKDFNLKKDIKIEKVDFAYMNSAKPAVKNVSINIPANSITSIVGPSGSGKSTILDILLGLLKPQKGEVFVDDQPLESILETYQQNISYVGQNIFLQNDSIRANICFGLDSSEIDEKKLVHAIEASNLSELIKELPSGVDTQVGERGVKISGGQQQRVAIARALYLDRSIIILDEATSGLDGISESYIIGKLKMFAENYKKTIIMVTHNINLTRTSNIIYLLNNGSVIESGNFDTLLNNEIFKNLLNEQ